MCKSTVIQHIIKPKPIFIQRAHTIVVKSIVIRLHPLKAVRMRFQLYPHAAVDTAGSVNPCILEHAIAALYCPIDTANVEIIYGNIP